MENKLDKYFKEHLDNRTFEMKDAYWEQAEAMLDKQEKNKKRGILIWWTGAAAIAALALISILFFINKDTNNPIAKEQENKQNIITDKLNEQQPNNTSSPDLKNIEKTPSPTETIKKENKKPAIESNNKAIPKPINANPKHTNKTRKSTLSNFNKINNKNDETKNIEQIKNIPANKIAAQKEIKNGKDNLRTKYSIGNISMLDISILKNKKTIELPLNPDKDYLNNCFKPDPFHIAFTASQLFQAAPKTGENIITGFSAGIVFQYDLNKHIYLSSGINYMRKDGHFNASKTTEKRNYRFGLELENKLLRPTSLHYISAPIMAGWQKRHHLLEGGIYLDYLMGVRGESGNYERIPGEPPTKEFVPTETGWLVEEGFSKFNISPSIGYRYRVNKQLSFGLSAQYALKRVAEMPSPNDFILKENDRFNWRLQAVYILK
ncbi:MAG TPA: PorT family protein [Bacteroidetes bacterium]|nr:PorT family protein [Bacteroidota bacterium]